MNVQGFAYVYAPACVREALSPVRPSAPTRGSTWPPPRTRLTTASPFFYTPCRRRRRSPYGSATRSARGTSGRGSRARGTVAPRVPRASVPLASDRVEDGPRADPARRAVRILPPTLRAEQRGPHDRGGVLGGGGDA